MIESLFENIVFVWNTMDFKTKLGVIAFIALIVIAKGKSNGSGGGGSKRNNSSQPPTN